MASTIILNGVLTMRTNNSPHRWRSCRLMTTRHNFPKSKKKKCVSKTANEVRKHIGLQWPVGPIDFNKQLKLVSLFC